MLTTLISGALGALVLYAVGHYACALIFLFSGRERSAIQRTSEAVTVLLPARNEGIGALHAVRSLLAQDHAGDVEVWVLVRDDNDTAWAHLASAYEFQDGVAEVSPERRIRWMPCGVDPKAAKIRHALVGVTTPYCAILDADHLAHPEWIRSALSCLAQSDGARAVQCRRYPFSARGFFRLWDSLHQHVGCELFNRAFQRLGLSVFFTGTTAVFETELLQRHPMRDVITEDVDLSYELFFEGEYLISDPRFGSVEQVSPDLFSFLARRRRWACGHTEAFLRHLRKLPKARLPLLSKLQFLFHGSHYLWALPVFVLHALAGYAFAPQLSPASLLGALLCATLLSGALVRLQRTRGVLHKALEFLVLGSWFFPAAILATNASIAVLTGHFERAALPLPEAYAYLQPLALAGFLAPLLLVLVGLYGFRQLTFGTFVHTTVTYPISFYLDVAAALLGALDTVVGRRTWRTIERELEDDSASLPPPSGLRESCALGGGVDLLPNAAAGAKASRVALAAAALAFLFAVFGSPARLVLVEGTNCEAREADSYPWITRPERWQHCQPGRRVALRRGFARTLHDDPLERVDSSVWTRGTATFPCNEAHFRPDNVVQADGALRLEVRAQAYGDRTMTAGALSTSEEETHLYGRFEVEMKPSPVSGVVSAFFLYRFDPWQEIDFEFVGQDTTKALLNVYYNPGEDGDEHNYGYFGTPVMVDLGFDAAESLHRYAIEWDEREIRWFVDDRLVHVRRSGEPTPIPHLPMVFHMNAWVSCSEDLAGPLDVSSLPTAAEFAHVTLSAWEPVPLTPLDRVFAVGDPEPDAWMR
ncbi:MAG: family 16 glycosylhydrolase [Myxococcota bacterium]